MSVSENMITEKQIKFVGETRNIKEWINDELNLKADLSYVNTELDLKADLSYLDSLDFAEQSYVDDNTISNLTFVDGILTLVKGNVENNIQLNIDGRYQPLGQIPTHNHDDRYFRRENLQNNSIEGISLKNLSINTSELDGFTLNVNGTFRATTVNASSGVFSGNVTVSQNLTVTNNILKGPDGAVTIQTNQISFTNLPSASTGLAAGRLYRSGSFVQVVV